MGDPGDNQHLPSVYQHDPEFDEEPDQDSDTSDDQYPYTTQELATIFTDFYRFLATLHYDPADLKLPPPEGWDMATLPAAIVDSKSEQVVDLMRHLPYFQKTEPSTHVHYKSRLIDYTDPERQGLAQMEHDMLDYIVANLSDEGRAVQDSDLLTIAGGYESYGRTFILDVLHGEITEEMIRAEMVSPVNVKGFFENLKEEFRTLKLIPCPGRETAEVDRVPELDRTITEEEIRAQSERFWGTDLDWQFVRQVYRGFGWPHEFRRREAVCFINEFMEQIEDIREDWESAFK